jgi:ABC-type multidrug transport system ATPase subunit
MADQEINAEQVYRFVSIAAPYLDLIEDFTLHEHLAFHFSLKQARESRPVNELVELSTLKKSAHKPIRFFSSGMKQRVRLLLAICSNTPLLLLDEPLSNLDEEGAAWYEKMIAEFGNDRTIIVASNNQLREYNFCTQQISLNQTY